MKRRIAVERWLRCLVLCAGAFSTAAAIDLDGFMRSKGHGDVAFSLTSEGYDEFWAGESKVSDPGVGDVETQTVSLWMAYGITDDCTVVATVPWVDTEGDGLAGFEEKDLQDLTIVGKYRLASFGSSIRGQLIGGIGIRTIASNYEANAPVDVGDGTADWLVRLVYLLQRGRFYASQQVGFDLRGGDAPDGYPLYTEIGYTRGRTTLTGLIQILRAESGTDIGDPGFTFPSNEEEYERVGLKAFIRLNDVYGLSAMAFATRDGRNTGDTAGLSLGLNFSF